MITKPHLDKIQEDIRNASDEDLLDRITFYRAGYEPEAILMIEVELNRRGITDERIEAWKPKEDDPYIWLKDGTAAPCSFCRRPAIRNAWGWHRLFGVIPIFPRIYRYCRDHGGGEVNEKE